MPVLVEAATLVADASVLYHGSNRRGLTELRPDIREAGDEGEYGIYLTPSRRNASVYGPYVYRVRAELVNPIFVPDTGSGKLTWVDERFGHYILTAADAQELLDAGHNSIVVGKTGDIDRASEVVVFDPSAVEIVGINHVEAAVLVADIQHPPRDFSRSLQMAKLRLSTIKKMVQGIETLASQCPDREDFESTLGFDEDDGHRLLSRVAKVEEMLRNLDQSLDAWKGNGAKQLESAKLWLDFADKDAADLAHWVPRRLSEAVDNIEYEVSQGRLDHKTADAMEQFAKNLPTAVAAFDLKPLLKALDESSRIADQAYGSGDDDERRRPATGATETLYHASIAAASLATTGFAAEVPKAGGIGGSQKDKEGNPAVSFTSDLYVAKEVARCLKEMVGLVQGTYPIRRFIAEMDEEGIKDDVLDSVRSLTGKTFDPSDPKHIMQAYSTYLWLSKRRRYNPVFFNPSVSTFIAADPKSIGVVACTVDMKDPAILYMTSMHEYRVPPRAILSVDRLIK